MSERVDGWGGGWNKGEMDKWIIWNEDTFI